MKKLILLFIVGSLFSEEPTVTIIDKYGTYVTGTIKKYEDGIIIIDSKKGCPAPQHLGIPPSNI